MCFFIPSQNFLENLDPFRGMDDADGFLYNESIRLEPKNAKQPLKFVSFEFKLMPRDALCIVFTQSLMIFQHFFVTATKMARFITEIAWHKAGYKTP